MADHTLDARDLDCPLPLLEARKALEQLPLGATLEIFTSDPGSSVDFEAFCRMTGNELLEQGEEGGVFRFMLRKMMP